MGRLVNLLARLITLCFWLGVGASLLALLPGKLNQFLPICGLVVALFHWLQASLIKAACKPYFALSRAQFVQILIFGVFATRDIRQQLAQITVQRSTS